MMNTQPFIPPEFKIMPELLVPIQTVNDQAVKALYNLSRMHLNLTRTFIEANPWTSAHLLFRSHHVRLSKDIEQLVRASSLAKKLFPPATQTICKELAIANSFVPIVRPERFTTTLPSIAHVQNQNQNSCPYIRDRNFNNRMIKSVYSYLLSEMKKGFRDLHQFYMYQDAAATHPESGQKRGRPQIRPFSMPPDVNSWKPVTIRVISDTEAEVQVGERTERRDFTGWGMVDRRTKYPQPTTAWNLLLLLAGQDGELSWGDSAASMRIRAHMKILRTRLREIFGLKGDPIEDYKKNKCWRTKFTIVDMRKYRRSFP